jgi:hypothetical protein
MSWELPPWVEPTRYQEIDPDEVQKGDIIGTPDVDHFHGIDTNGKQRAATFRRPGQKVRRYIRTAERRGN